MDTTKLTIWHVILHEATHALQHKMRDACIGREEIRLQISSIRDSWHHETVADLMTFDLIKKVGRMNSSSFIRKWKRFIKSNKLEQRIGKLKDFLKLFPDEVSRVFKKVENIKVYFCHPYMFDPSRINALGYYSWTEKKICIMWPNSSYSRNWYKYVKVRPK